MRRDILTKKNSGIPATPPAKHPFKMLCFLRLLTRDNPAGKPSLRQIPITGTRDLLKMGLQEMVVLEDEHGGQIMHLIDYGRRCTTGHDVVENMGPDRLLALADPIKPSRRHEPGIPTRLGHEIQALNALRLSLAQGQTLTRGFLDATEREEARLVEWLDLIEQLEDRFYSLSTN